MININSPKGVLRTFWYAITGLAHAIYVERNLKVHFLAMLGVSVMAAITNCSAIEWSILLLCFAVVIGLETMNTAVEKTCDFTTTYHSTEIKIIKDVAAGAVFFASICSALIGGIILLPKLINLI
jgi:undecaprenol kinase/diacylglycerol kinase (ATP)